MGAGGLVIPRSRGDSYSTDTEKNYAHVDYYVNCHPEAEWENITAGLYNYKEFALVRESKSFMSTGKNTATTTDILV